MLWPWRQVHLQRPSNCVSGELQCVGLCPSGHLGGSCRFFDTVEAVWAGMEINKAMGHACCGTSCPNDPPVPPPPTPVPTPPTPVPPPPTPAPTLAPTLSCDPACAHGGECTSAPSGNVCKCKKGYAGPGCSVNVLAECTRRCSSCFAEYSGAGGLCLEHGYASCKDSYMESCPSDYIRTDAGCHTHCQESPPSPSGCLPRGNDCEAGDVCCKSLTCYEQSGMGACKKGETGCYCD